MRKKLLVLVGLLSLIGAACGNDSGSESGNGDGVDTDPTTTVAEPEGDGGDETADDADEGAGPSDRELVIDAVSFGDDGTVTITNVSATQYGLTGHFVCNRPVYVPLPDIVLEPGESVTVPSGDLSLDSASGEVGLYFSNEFGNADAMLGYVEYGSSGRGREPVAVEAGLWTEGEFVDNGGAGFTRSGPSPLVGADYDVG